ncbi:ABC-type nitrate/sulfonate/bicarbonate transport system substrate-binding protein [Desulfohalotomaculum tongense]|uniref:ABC transporter substrate-binding protein n=1 Tax=Desulforadius tongensis TaxID=1216062 RepID=UPI001958275B|nr:ABC transporter substrate-binding protein [Desulforadius tongensis]MBM7855541.1 ABC-type nitrate/sulfonate/bicarbonate transport system substrate-binding protein [Desulforadius tongensis]
MRKIIAVVLSLLLVVGLAACGRQENQVKEQGEKPLEKVTVMLDWVPNTNHTGLYAALEKGWYKEQGLDVEIISPAEGGTTQLVATNKVDFGVSYQEDVTMARANGVPVVSIAAVIQHNTSGLASKKEDNITTPKDLEGRRYGGWGSPTEEAVIKAIMENAGADFNKVQFINIGQADFFSVIGRDVDFTWIYYGWDGVEAQRRGIPLNVMMLKDLHPALDYYTPVLISSEKTIADNPELVKKFMAATAKGYQFAIEHPEEAAEILLKHAPELDKELVVASQKWLSTRYRDDAPRWGEQKKEVWENYTRWMYRWGLLPEMIAVDKAFTNDFLP